MKRREMIKAAGALAAAPVFFGNASGIPGNGSTESVPRQEIRKFGDGRDWFFENVSECSFTGGSMRYLPGMSNTSGGQGCREKNT